MTQNNSGNNNKETLKTNMERKNTKKRENKAK